MEKHPSKPRLLLFAFGDFAFNLYWQSVMLFLLFYYTDALMLPIGVAATTYMVASVWDGIANFGAGVLIDKRSERIRYDRLLTAGAIPLGLTFVLAYSPPVRSGYLAIVTVFVTHLLFRTAYAGVNVPYLAMTARITEDPSGRALVAGMRMLFGTAAAVVVALGTVPIGRFFTGSSAAAAYFVAALVFASIGTIVLVIVGSTYREGAQVEHPRPASVRASLASLARNRAFVALNAATMAMIVAMTVLGKSVLYYFKYLLNDAHAGELALASMAIVSGVAVPLWMLVGRFVGLKALWLIAAGIGLIALIVFRIVPFSGTHQTQLFLVVMEVASIGMNFVFWAMLPNTIEFGARTTGVHVEGAVFGVAALLQRIAIGFATAVLGWSFASAGYVANVTQNAGTLSSMRSTVATVPFVFLALSCVAMLLNPLGRAPNNSDDEIEGSADAVRLR